MFFGERYRVLRGGSWATAPASRDADVPQLGPAASAGRSSPGCAWPRTEPADGVVPPVVGALGITIESHLDGQAERSLADDVLDGLTRPFKELPPKHFYDARGAELFDRICELPEYYPTRTERAILERSADEIAEVTGAVELVELGSGTAAKTRVLLDALHAAGTLRRYVPLDVTESMVRDCARELTREYPGLRVHGVIGDFERHLDRVPPAEGPRIVAFLGGTIGNFPPGQPPALPASDRTSARPRGPPADGDRSGQGPERAGGRLRRRRRRHRRVQPQRAAGAQPRAGRRLRPLRLRARGAVRPRARVDRDAPARAPRRT